MTKDKFNPVPPFTSYEEEAHFWDTHDVMDLSEIPDEELSPSVRKEKQKKLKDSITVRFQPADLQKLRETADEKGIAVTTLIRMFTLEKLKAQDNQQV